MAVKKHKVAVNSIEVLYKGKKREFAPGEVLPDDVNLDGIPDTAYRAAEDAESALYMMQNGGSTAPKEVMQQPQKANGPGGATQENVGGTSGNVASDRDSVGTSEQGKTTTTDPALAGAAGGAQQTEGSSSAENTPKPKTAKARKKRDADLA